MMQKFKVTGADRMTGEPREVFISAADERDAAERAAVQHGMVVSNMAGVAGGTDAPGGDTVATMTPRELHSLIFRAVFSASILSLLGFAVIITFLLRMGLW